MAKSIVEAGVYGFVTEVEAILDKSQKVTLSIVSDCPHVMVLAEEYPQSEGMMEVFMSFGESPLLRRLKTN